MEIIAPAAVVTPDPATGQVTAVEGHGVLVDGVRILEVDELPGLQATHPDATVTRRPHHVLLPGMVNAHHHVGLTPFQHGVPDSSLETWIAGRVAEDDVDLRLDTLYSAAQLIRSGVTAVQHIQGWYATDATSLADGARTTIDAYVEAGLRVSFSKMIRDQNLFVHTDDRFLLAVLPEEARVGFERVLAGQSVPLQDQLQLFESLTADYAGQDGVAVQLAPANFHWMSDDALAAVADEARRFGVPMHMHLLETPYQREYLKRRSEGQGVRYLERFGMLSPGLTLGHGTWLDPEDVAAVAEHGVHVCHNCSSNFRLSSGRAPVTTLLEAGVGVGIGIDEAGINDDRDMLQELRMVYCTNRESGILGRRLTAAQVLAMATTGGADTTPFAGRIGRIAPGREADLVLMDLEALTFPYQQAGADLPELIVQRGRDRMVTDVMIRGRWVMTDSVLQTIDERALLDEIHASLGRVDPAEHHARKNLAEALGTAVGSFFTETYGL